MNQGTKRSFYLDAHSVTDLAAFAIQSFDNEALTRLTMPQTSGSLKFGLLLLLPLSVSLIVRLSVSVRQVHPLQ